MRCCAAGPWPHGGGALTTLLLTGRSRRRFTAARERGPRLSPRCPPLPRDACPLPAPPLVVPSFYAAPLCAGSELPRHPPLLPGAAEDTPMAVRPPFASPPAERTAAARPPPVRRLGGSAPGLAGTRDEGARPWRGRGGGRGLAVWERVCRQGWGGEAWLRAAGWWGRLRSRGQGRAAAPAAPLPSLDLTGLVLVPEGPGSFEYRGVFRSPPPPPQLFLV